MTSNIATCLWFDGNAKEAVEFYVSLFPESSITYTHLYPEGSPGEAGTLMMIEFTLMGHDFTALNGGDEFGFTPAISFQVLCDSQPQIDRLGEALADGGQELQCGWVTDRFGVTWQIVPRAMMTMLKDDDKAKVQKAFSAMLEMVKLDVNKLKEAFES